MTFNRYICFRAILESIGAIACMLMALIGNNLLGVIVAAIAALLWIGGEVWGMTVFRRQNPRRDELSDMHQSAAMQFALVSLVGILVIVGFIYTTLNLIDRSIVHIIPPMLLPALAMCALAISDIRYLWLEHDAGTEGDDVHGGVDKHEGEIDEESPVQHVAELLLADITELSGGSVTAIGLSAACRRLTVTAQR